MVRGEIIAVVVFNFTGSQLKLWVVKLTCLYGFGKGVSKIKIVRKRQRCSRQNIKLAKKKLLRFIFPKYTTHAHT